MTTEACPLSGDRSSLFFESKMENAKYFRCPRCEAVFLSRENRLSAEDEKDRYSLHQNNPKDQAYRKFLSQLQIPLLERIKDNSSGLDYGSGPGPTLAKMFQEEGHLMSNYDPFFAPNKAVLKKSYDFIGCSETAEHFHNPDKEFSKLSEMLLPGGILGLMTLLLKENENFELWHYRKDPTHVFFYTVGTLEFIKENYFTKLEIISNRVALFKKSSYRSFSLFLNTNP